MALSVRILTLIALQAAHATALAGGGGVETCPAAWSEEFVVGDAARGAFAVFDEDGDGPQSARFFSTGILTANAIFEPIARWDGSSWTSVGGGFDGTGVSLIVFDPDEDGPAAASLVASGTFTSAGGIAASRIARWDGEQWHALGSGLNADARSMTLFDEDGAGPNSPRLIVADRDITSAGGVAVSGVARWDGTSWSALGPSALAPAGSQIFSMVSFDADGAGPEAPKLIAVGDFTSIGGVAANRVAAWNGASWEPLGSGANQTVRDAVVFDEDHDGPEPSRLFICGDFQEAGGMVSNRIARWDGSAWSVVGAGFTNGSVNRLYVFDDDGDGPAMESLIAAGDFLGPVTGTRGIARWDGGTWSAMDRGLGDTIDSGAGPMIAFDEDGFGPDPARLFVSGAFRTASTVKTYGVARWDGSHWSPLGSGANGPVHTFATIDGDLYAAGSFNHMGRVPVPSRIARWDGQEWVGVGAGLSGPVNFRIESLVGYDIDGDGPEPERPVAAGTVWNSGETPINNITIWDGKTWQPMGDGLPGSAVTSLAVYDADGPGPELGQLYAAGSFAQSGKVQTRNVARWTGTGWEEVGGGTNSLVYTMVVHDEDGEGPELPKLFAAGVFGLAGGVSVSGIARWDGVAWTRLGTGPTVNFQIRALHSFDADGAGGAPPTLIVGGLFTMAGGMPAQRIAQWDGMQWSAMGDGFPAEVFAIASLDEDGPGPLLPMLVAGNRNTPPNGQTARIARWDGAAWIDLAILTEHPGEVPSLLGLYAFDDDGDGPKPSRLYAGGNFLRVNDVLSQRIAAWGRSIGPAISDEPEDLTVRVGHEAVLSVAATGSAPLSYRWRRDGVELFDSPGAYGAFGPEFTIEAAAPGDAGDYDVRIENSCGDATSMVATLVVNECIADIDGDGQVNSSDLAILLGSWGSATVLADLDDSGVVGAGDLALLLGGWGACD